MNHTYIEEHQIVARYAMGKLDPADHVAFEEHLVDCSRCLDELELTDNFRGALRRTLAEAPAAPPASAFRGWRAAVALAAGVVVVAGATALLFTGRTGSLRADLERARVASADWERRFVSERHSRQAAEAQLQESLAQNAAPLFTLSLTRGAGLSSDEPPNQILIRSGVKSIALSLEWQPSPEFQSFRADLTNAEGRTLWTSDRLTPPSSNALAITLPSSLFPAGDYLLTIKGSARGREAAVAHYRFRVALAK